MTRLIAATTLTLVLFGNRVTAQESATAHDGPLIEAIDLGMIYPGVSTQPRAVNERATVVGVAQFPDGTQSAFLWTRRSGFREIVQNGGATDINKRGEVVGYLNSCGYYCGGFHWSDRTGLHDLGEFVPSAINDKGDIAGQCGQELPQPCVLIDGILHHIAVEHYGLALDINNRGVVAGSVYRPVEDEGFAPQAFTWSLSEGLQLLPAGDASTTEAQAINKRGTVAGTAAFSPATPDPAFVQAAVWEKGSMDILAGSDWYALGFGINDRGWIVGVVSRQNGTTPFRPLLWIPQSVALELPAPAGLDGYYAADVTNSGLIVGAAYDDTGTHAVLWMVTGAKSPK